uniref:RNI-like protein n=1 Tax=Arcella intermedia TaxID=1963864 RepID=A0A6B2LHL5_9EUKA
MKLNSTVRSIDLSYNKIDEQGALFISEFLKSNSTITSINLSDNAIEAKGALSILETLNTFPTAITSIDVSCNPINPYVSQLFPILLEKQTTIQFPRSYLGDPAVGYISQFLKSNSTVTTVDIRNNQVGPEGAGYIAECLKSNSTLTSINLRDNRIKHEGALVILHALKSNTTLKSIDLNWNSIDSSAFQLAVDAQYSGRDNIPSISF